MGGWPRPRRSCAHSLLIRPEQPDVIQHWLHVRQKHVRVAVPARTIPGLSRDDLIRNCGPLARAGADR